MRVPKVKALNKKKTIPTKNYSVIRSSAFFPVNATFFIIQESLLLIEANLKIDKWIMKSASSFHALNWILTVFATTHSDLY